MSKNQRINDKAAMKANQDFSGGHYKFKHYGKTKRRYGKTKRRP